MMLSALSLSAQTTYDAVRFSEENLYGTARSIALGNAVSALGGDLGSVSLNPAGSAVAKYSQFVFSPSVNIANSNASYDVQAGKEAGTFGSTPYAKFTVPNFGFSMNFDTGSGYGLKNWTFAFLFNMSNNYADKIFVEGDNPHTSILGAIASQAEGLDPKQLDKYGNFSDSNYPWNALVGYQSGMIQHIEGSSYSYKGASEIATANGKGGFDISQGGTVHQTYSRKHYGTKYDMVLNFAGNISDELYVGANFGFPMMNYRTNEYITEAAADPRQFPTVFASGTSYYQNSSYRYNYKADMNGFYAKLGLIWRPFGGLRLAATAQTPTAATVKESWYMSGSCTFDNSSGNASSPTGDYVYSLSSPYALGAGVAYTLGNFALVSAEYEMKDYSVMRYSPHSVDDVSNETYFSHVNEANRRFTGIQNTLRFGGEIKFGPAFSIRGGYSVKTSPEKYYYNDKGEFVDAVTFVNNYDAYMGGARSLKEVYTFKDKTHSYSGGIGYSSNGSMFMDFTIRYTVFPQAMLSMYSDYAYLTGTSTICPSPGVTNFRRLLDAVLTIGFRF